MKQRREPFINLSMYVYIHIEFSIDQVQFRFKEELPKVDLLTKFRSSNELATNGPGI